MRVNGDISKIVPGGVPFVGLTVQFQPEVSISLMDGPTDAIVTSREIIASGTAFSE